MARSALESAPREVDEGTEVLILPVSDGMDARERVEFDTMLDESFDDLRAGEAASAS